MEKQSSKGCRHTLGILGVASVVLLIYASVIPLQYRPLDWSETLQRWKNIPWLNLGITNRADWIANGLVVIPCSFLLVGSLNGSKSSGGLKSWVFSLLGALLVLIFLFVLVYCIELVQVWFPPRTVSWNDVVSGWVGALIGALIWLGFGEKMIDAVRRFLMLEDFEDRLTAFGWFACLAAILYSTYPFDFIVSLREWHEKLDSGRIQWGGHIKGFASREWLQGLVFSAVRMIPFAMVSIGWKSAMHRWAWLLLVPLALEMVQLPIYSKYSSFLDVLAGCLGGFFGVVIYRWSGLWDWIRGARWLWSLAIVLWSGLLLVAYLARGERWVVDPVQLNQRWSGFFEYPLLRYYYGSEYSAVTNLAGKILSFSALGGLIACDWMFGRKTSPRFWSLVLLVGLLGLIIEVSQLYLEPLIGDINDIWVYVLGALLGSWGTLFLFRGQRATAETPYESNRASRQVDVPSLPIARALIGFSFGLLGIYLASIHPGWRFLQVTMVLVLFGIVYHFGFLYPLFFVLLLVGGDAYPLTGQLALQEFDSLLAGATCGLVFATKKLPRVGDANSSTWKIDRLMLVGLGLLFISTVISSAIGLIRLPSAPWGDQLSVYFTQWNVIRISKGILWGAVFAMMTVLVVGKAGNSARTQWQLVFLRGCSLAGLYVGLFVALERWIFPGLWNWEKVYRATGPFFTMHIGDHHIDAFLAMVFPLVWANLLYPNTKQMERWFCGLVLVLMLYAASATMTRATLGTLLLESCLLLFLTWTMQANASRSDDDGLSLRARTVFWIGGFLGFALIAGLVSAISTQAMQSRFAKSTDDWNERTSHWRMILSRGTTGIGGVGIGHGIGTLPSLIASEFDRPFPPLQWSFDSESDSPQGEIRMRGRWPIYLERIFWQDTPWPEKPLQLQAKLDRSVDSDSLASDPTSVVASLVEKSVLESYQGKSHASPPVGTEWTGLDLSALENIGTEVQFDPRRPKSLGLHVPSNGSLVVSGFSESSIGSRGSYPWYFTCDEHMVWRALNFAVHTYYEQGLIGVFAWAVLLGGCVSRGFGSWLHLIKHRVPDGSFPIAIYQAVCVLGFVGVGIFGSLVDTPWITALLLGILSIDVVRFKSLADGQRAQQSQGYQRAIPSGLSVCICVVLLSSIGCDSLSPIEGKASSRSIEGTPKSAEVSSKASNGTDLKDMESGKWIGPQRVSQSRFLRAPRLASLDFPHSPGANAILGATGRDLQGRIYFGVAAYGDEELSAALFRYEPNLKRFESLGLVNNQLDLLKVRRKIDWPETQMKIHSKIYQAADGRMYFSTQDEHDEASDGSRNALYGGRLMAMDPKTKVWESIHTAPEGLIALSARGRYVVAQGYFGHVLYQYDTTSKSIRSVKLGTYKGHSSRNIFMDFRSHVYGIRARIAHSYEFDGVYQIGQDRVRVSLVELNTHLEEVNEWPLSDYEPTGSTDSHGLTGFCEMQDGSIVFVTHSGALWQIRHIDGQVHLEKLGWMHPKGKSYCASLYAPGGERYICGICSIGEGKYEWVVFDAQYKRSVVLPLDSKSLELLQEPKLLLYGSDTLDESGCGYLVGRKQSAQGNAMEPVVLRVIWE